MIKIMHYALPVCYSNDLLPLQININDFCIIVDYGTSCGDVFSDGLQPFAGMEVAVYWIEYSTQGVDPSIGSSLKLCCIHV